MNKLVYVVPFECVEHLYDDEDGYSNRAKVKRIAKKCGDVYNIAQFEAEFNKGNISSADNLILIGGEE